MDFRAGEEKDLIFSKEDQHFANNDEIWDDSALIKMYEESIQKTYKKLAKEVPLSPNNVKTRQKEWRVGDLCLAPYYGDNLWYPAVIKEIIFTNGTCIVSYEEYDELATVKISELEPREDESEASDDTNSTKVMKLTKVKSSRRNGGNNEASRSYNLPNSSEMASNGIKVDLSKGHAPPFEMPSVMPPPPHMFSGIALPNDDEVVSNMLLSWYMCGYHTGYYQAVQSERRKKNLKCKQLSVLTIYNT